MAEDPDGRRRARPAEDDELVDAVHERTTLARAFAALPERWQTFLWLSFVDDADRGEIATILGINVGSVSALGYRAREGLRRAYLDAHLRDAPTPECAEVWPLLAGAVRGGLGADPAGRGRRAHSPTCEHCRAAVAELEAVNTRFGAVLAPIVLGAAAPAYLAAVQHGGAVAAAARCRDERSAAGGRGRATAADAPGPRAPGTEGDAGRDAWARPAPRASPSWPASRPSPWSRCSPRSPPRWPPSSSVPPRPGTHDRRRRGVPGPGSDGTGDDGGAERYDGRPPAARPATRTSPTDRAIRPVPARRPPARRRPPRRGGPTGLPTATTTGRPHGRPDSAARPPDPSRPLATATGPTGTGRAHTATAPPSTHDAHRHRPATPTATPPAGPVVDAALAGVVVQSRSQASYAGARRAPGDPQGGTADLQVMVTVVGPEQVHDHQRRRRGSVGLRRHHADGRRQQDRGAAVHAAGRPCRATR